MAQQVVVSLVDDLDGGTAEETVHFALDGKTYDIDLSKVNADKLRGVFSEFIAVARKAPSNGKAPRVPPGAKLQTASRSKDELAEIREWARSKGMKCSDRGRVPNDVLEAFDARYNNAS